MSIFSFKSNIRAILLKCSGIFNTFSKISNDKFLGKISIIEFTKPELHKLKIFLKLISLFLNISISLLKLLIGVVNL